MITKKADSTDNQLAWALDQWKEGPPLTLGFAPKVYLPNTYAVFLGLDGGVPLHVKIEGLNVAGSIKLKPALRMVHALEEQGLLREGGKLIESSSGNLGLALSIVAAERGYRFTCVTDPLCTEWTRAQMQAHGAEVVTVTTRDDRGGFLGTRIEVIKRACEADPELRWINQYANEYNWIAHYETTAREILTSFSKVDWLFVGAGTCGTLMGCLRYFREHSPGTRIIAVDAQGSTTFGGVPSKRNIPGLGTTRTPEILRPDEVPSVVYAAEIDAIRTCHALKRGGVSVGGSTGSVVSAVQRHAAEFGESDVIVAISPDLGMKYMDTVYNQEWCAEKFPALREPSRAATGSLNLE